MTDYKNLKLIATSNPHIRGSETTRSIMLDVIIAMLPALIWAVVKFGPEALVLTAVSVIGCVFFEWAYRSIMKRPQSVGDLSAVVTGMLLSFVCPPSTPLWMILIGDFFAIVVVKQLFGGIGKNFLNPALAGRAFLMLSYSGLMTTWAKPGEWVGITDKVADAVSCATPMGTMHGSTVAAATLPWLGDAGSTLQDLFLGTVPGCIGEVSALALILGGVYLVLRGVIHIRIPAAYLGTVALLTLIFPKGNDPVQWTLCNLFSGGLMLGAFFMATDYVTSPCTPVGEWIYGVGCGLLTVFIRYFGGFPEGVSYAILLMNVCAPIIEKYTHPGRFGVQKGGAKA